MLFRTTVIMALAAALALVACAQTPDGVVRWSIHAPPTARAGAKISLELRAAIVGGWHIYSITQMPGGPTRTVISLPDRQPFQKEGAVTGPKPDKSFDPNFSLDTETYEGAIRFSVPVRTAKDAVAGKAKIAVDVLFQSCNDTTCLPPHTTHLFAPIHIEQRLPASSARSTAPLPSKPPAAPGVAAQ